MPLTNKIITFLGAGSMAEAMISGMIQNKIVNPEQIIATNVQNKEQLTHLAKTYGVKTTQDRIQAVNDADLIILAMKPKHLEDAIQHIKPALHLERQLFISILAGITTAQIERLLGERAAVIRTMPNTSAKVNESATAITMGTHTNESQLQSAKILFSAIGAAVIVTEDKLDAVTGLAGSGPAYFYYLVEAMERAATDAGLTSEEAKAFIAQTVVGVGKQLQTTSKSMNELYTEVMSPQGTTEAGIHVLRDLDAQSIVYKAVSRAIERSKELGAMNNNS